jgi:hypothetical protein
MAEQKVDDAPAGLDHRAIAAGLGDLVEGTDYDRLVVDGRTIAYIKKGTVAAHLAHLARLPKKLGTAEPEKSGPWANVRVDSDATARAILEHVVAQVGA